MILTRLMRLGCVGLVVIVMTTCLSFAIDENGAELFKARCAPCHGSKSTGKRSTKAPSLTSDHVKAMSDEQIAALVASRANGEMEKKSAHQSMKKRLTSSEITAVVDHIRELQKAK